MRTTEHGSHFSSSYEIIASEGVDPRGWLFVVLVALSAGAVAVAALPGGGSDGLATRKSAATPAGVVRSALLDGHRLNAAVLEAVRVGDSTESALLDGASFDAVVAEVVAEAEGSVLLDGHRFNAVVAAAVVAVSD